MHAKECFVALQDEISVVEVKGGVVREELGVHLVAGTFAVGLLI